MQEAVDELFVKLGRELANSIEIKKFVQNASQAK